MNTIALSDHARNRLHQRLGLPKRALQRFVCRRVDSPEVVDEAHLRNSRLRHQAAELRQKRTNGWITWDPTYRIFYVWAIERVTLVLVTAVFPSEDGRWSN